MSIWDGKAEAYQRSRSSVCGGTIPRILGLLRSGIVADIGCGSGDFTLAAAKAGFQVSACDADKQMVAITHDLLADHELYPSKQVSIRQDELPQLDYFDEGGYSNVVANFVVNHVARPLTCLKGLARIVCPGGQVITTIWTSDYLPHRDLVIDALTAHISTPATPDRRGNAEDLDADFERSVAGLSELNTATGLSVRIAQIVSWEWEISWDDFWLGMTAGIGGTGEAFLAQPEDIKQAIEADVLTASKQYLNNHGNLVFPCQAALCVAEKS